MGRTCPDLDAELFFDPDEIRGAYLLSRARQPARPKLNEVLCLIVSLGGFLGRKGDGEPGAKAIWPDSGSSCRGQNLASATRGGRLRELCIRGWV